MKGGANRKTAQQHIEDGTYRGDRHSELSLSDSEVLKEIKINLYSDYIAIRKEIKKLDLSKDLEKYEQLNKIRIEFVKAFYSIAKAPMKNEQNKDIENKDGFKA